jgi:hypothetical protein
LCHDSPREVEEEETSAEAADPYIQQKMRVMTKDMTSTMMERKKAIMMARGQKTTEEEGGHTTLLLINQHNDWKFICSKVNEK